MKTIYEKILLAHVIIILSLLLIVWPLTGIYFIYTPSSLVSEHGNEAYLLGIIFYPMGWIFLLTIPIMYSAFGGMIKEMVGSLFNKSSF